MNNFDGCQFQVRKASRDAIKGIKWFWLLKVMDKVKKTINIDPPNKPSRPSEKLLIFTKDV